VRHRLSREDEPPEAREIRTRPGRRPRAILIAGPTASGKSALAIKLALRLGGVVVNCDSMQVYADLRIITARPSPAEERDVPHRLFGHVDAACNWSAGRWLNDVQTLFNEIDTQRRLPLFVGGTGLYFKALTQGLSAMPPVPASVREEVRAQAEDQPSTALHARLSARDPATAARLRPSDRQRIIRALEVLEASGRPLAEWQGGAREGPLLDVGDCVAVFLSPEREKLRARIDERFETMLAEGALDEVAALERRGLDPALPAMRAHGVPWLLAHLRGEISLGEAAREGKADTRRYAKRQFTWFRHQMPGWIWHNPAEAEEAVLAAVETMKPEGRELV
jgi:tRNA dimethylallyltransferase